MSRLSSTNRHSATPVWLMVAAAIAIAVGCTVYVNEDYETGEGGPSVGGWIGGGGAGGIACGAEICDGFDNDCDGQVDEDCPCDPGDTQACYTGNPVTVGIGNCQAGEQICAPTGFWGACSGEHRPSEELCDIYDNDCDGFIDEDCPCNPGDTQACYTGNPVTQGIGECDLGEQTCGDDGHWEPACVGAVGPTTEICNGLDDDCDGATDLDDSPAEDICPAVPNGMPDCDAGVCIIGSCDTDYSDPNGVYDDGCECLANPLTSVGNTCANAIDIGTLSDVAQDLTNQTANGGPPGRELWYRFQATDDLDTAGDEFHVDVRFMVNPGDAYAMDIYQNGCSAGDQIYSGEWETFDWYTDFNQTTTGCTVAPPCGEGNCVASNPQPGENTCDDQSAVFYFRLYRIDGAASCDEYTLEFSNGVY